VKDLNVSHLEEGRPKQILLDVGMEIGEGETVGLIGPSASGKTVTALALFRLLDPMFGGSAEWSVEGMVQYRGRDVYEMPQEEFRGLRSREISMIYQKPRRALHPIHMIGWQTGEPVEVHDGVKHERLKEMVVDYLGRVGLPGAERRFYHYRHQFSGGESQRIMIAMAIIKGPSLLIADEPTTDLDVTVQRQVLELLKDVRRETGLSILLITHDLAVIAEMSDRVYVMYAGRIVEHGSVFTIFEEPAHPFTRGLLASMPRIDSDHFSLEGMRGEHPTPPYDIPGCVFHPRCDFATPACLERPPTLEELKRGHWVACHNAAQKA
jgi:oligopeptide/dipeptide ABC transporter ATP-binding protein